MANSGQNFLDLLFGGINKGVSQFRQERDQRADLALTLQQMLERRQNRAEDVRFRQRGFEADEAYRKSQLERQGRVDAFNEGQANVESLRRGSADAKANAAEVAQLKFWTDMAAKATNPQMAELADLMLGNVPAGAVTAMMRGQGKTEAVKNPFQDRVDWYYKQLLGQKGEGGEPMSHETAMMQARKQAAQDLGGAPPNQSAQSGSWLDILNSIPPEAWSQLDSLLEGK